MDDGHAPVPEYRTSTRGSESTREEMSSGAELTFLSFTRHVVVVSFVHYVENVWSTQINKYKKLEEYTKICVICIGRDSNPTPPYEQT